MRRRDTQEIYRETSYLAPGLEGRTVSGSGSRTSGRERVLRREPGNVNAGGATVKHNTLSADATHVQVFYPFHPLHGYSLRISRRPKRGDGAVSVIDPVGKRLKIPVWMLLSDAAAITIAEKACLSRESLLNLTSLLERQAVSGISDNLLQTSADGCKGDHDAAATTLGPDANRRGTRACRSGGKIRTGRSHGPHSGESISNGNKEDK
jgi:hypothetical protein